MCLVLEDKDRGHTLAKRFAPFGMRCKVAQDQKQVDLTLLIPALGPPEPLGPDTLCTLTVLVFFSWLAELRKQCVGNGTKADAPVLHRMQKSVLLWP